MRWIRQLVTFAPQAARPAHDPAKRTLREFRAASLRTRRKIPARSLLSRLGRSTPRSAGQQASITGDTAAVLGHAAAMSKTSASSAQGLPNPFTSLWNGGREVLRSMSYHEMKNRAGIIGRNGLLDDREALRRQRGDPCPPDGAQLRRPARRLLALRPARGRDRREQPRQDTSPDRGAFSHFAFANPVPDFLVSGPGALWNVAGNVNGPLLATFTAADRLLPARFQRSHPCRSVTVQRRPQRYPARPGGLASSRRLPLTPSQSSKTRAPEDEGGRYADMSIAFSDKTESQ